VPDPVGATSRRRVVIQGGTVVDLKGARRGDVAIEDGRIVEVAASIEPAKGATVLDAAGCLVSPGLVDLHTHLREPGGEAAETVESGARAAALGGYTAVVAMPNTDPPIDSAAVARDVLSLGAGATCEVAVAGAITVGRKGERIAPFAEMAGLGIKMFSDDGRGVQDAGVMRRALEYASDLGLVLAQHCEDESLSRGGHMHEGAISSRLGIPAQPASAEEAMVLRDLELAKLTGAKVHFCHLSTRHSINLVAAARENRIAVTCEVTPHHLSLTDASVESFDPRFKVNPPLRTDDDVEALRAGCADGRVDAIATDHAPHTAASKEGTFDEAPFGMIGLETAYAVAYSALVADRPADATPLERLVGLLSAYPARISGLHGSSGQGGPIVSGAIAHLCVFDPTERWVVDPKAFASRSHNSPFTGTTLTGRVRHTILAGEPVVVDGQAMR
jgi:dihydroorotase